MPLNIPRKSDIDKWFIHNHSDLLILCFCNKYSILLSYLRNLHNIKDAGKLSLWMLYYEEKYLVSISHRKYRTWKIKCLNVNFYISYISSPVIIIFYSLKVQIFLCCTCLGIYFQCHSFLWIMNANIFQLM